MLSANAANAVAANALPFLRLSLSLVAFAKLGGCERSAETQGLLITRDVVAPKKSFDVQQADHDRTMGFACFASSATGLPT